MKKDPPLLQLADRLAPASKRPRQLVGDALADPAAHARAHAGHGRFRFAVPDEKVAWLVLVDALIDAGRVTEVDWRADRKELVASLRPLLPKGVRLDWRALPEQAAWSILGAVKSALAAHQLALLTMDIDSDSYPLIVVEKHAQAALIRLARAAGQVMRSPDRAPKVVAPHQPPTSRWQELVALAGGGPGEHPQTLLRGLAGAHQSAVRAALPSAPAAARPYLRSYLLITEGDCVGAARSTKTPRQFLATLAVFDLERKQPPPGRRQMAADVLARRLKLSPRSVELLHDFISSCWVHEPSDLRQFAALPTATQQRLSALAIAIYLAHRQAPPLIPGWGYLPYKLLAFVGDREGWRLLDETEPRNRRGRVLSDDAVSAQAWMVKRLGKRALRPSR